MKHKFTPGTWLSKGKTVYALNEDGYNRFSALVQDAHKSEEELEANARLIAAAPELLGLVLRRVKNEEQLFFEVWLERAIPAGDAESVQRQWKESSCYQDFLVEWGDEVAAIAKATGEQE